MPEFPTSRWRFIKDAFVRPVGAVVTVPYALWGILAFLRDEIVQPRNITLWKRIFWLSKLPWYSWLISTLVVALTFMLQAVGDACEIRIGPIAIEATRIGTDDGHPLIYPRQTIEFQPAPVPGLRDGSMTVVPLLLSWESYGRAASRWPGDAGDSMKRFIHAIWLVRRYRAAQSVLGRDDIDFRGSEFKDAELDVSTERLRQPFEIRFDFTYWNSEHTQQWRRTETFVYASDRHGVCTSQRKANAYPERVRDTGGFVDTM